uniref:PHF7/G2E3-like PHD zinc finger domain-containing protein n=1 Tax=Gallus gallus TaxID=9031 RepID=A0A8V1AN36_CHICK
MDPRSQCLSAPQANPSTHRPAARRRARATPEREPSPPKKKQRVSEDEGECRASPEGTSLCHVLVSPCCHAWGDIALVLMAGCGLCKRTDYDPDIYGETCRQDRLCVHENCLVSPNPRPPALCQPAPRLMFPLLQGQALRAALHHFRCPLCQDMQTFQAEMFRLGIKIPDRDAAWEEEGAFNELYQRHNSCDASLCLCSLGRDYSNNTGPWRMLLCSSCASCGTHQRCSAIPEDSESWECSGCSGVGTGKKCSTGSP